VVTSAPVTVISGSLDGIIDVDPSARKILSIRRSGLTLIGRDRVRWESPT
jgi:hypothetical protein